MDESSLVKLLFEASDAAKRALDGLADWGPSGHREGQYLLDVAADGAVLEILNRGGIRILSEESGFSGAGPLLAVVDPIDGSTNAHRGLPMYSTSICVLDDGGPWVGTVVDHVSGKHFHAIRGQGAWCDGATIRPSMCRRISDGIIGVSGALESRLGSWQFRALGCASLELCAVAEGSLDGYLLVGGASLRPWDYLAGLLICVESGASVGELNGLDLWLRVDMPRAPVAAATPALLGSLMSWSARHRPR